MLDLYDCEGEHVILTDDNKKEWIGYIVEVEHTDDNERNEEAVVLEIDGDKTGDLVIIYASEIISIKIQ